MFPARTTLVFLACAAALSAAAAQATQVVHVDTKELTLGSSDIVIGEVASSEARWNEAHTKIFTEVKVRVTRSLKGAKADELTLRQLGGTVGSLRYNVPGTPAFTPGEEALFFVWRDPQGRAQLNGLAQGKFEIRRDPATGARYVQRALPGLAVSDVRRLSLVPEGRPAPPLPLDDLVQEIQRVLAEGGR